VDAEELETNPESWKLGQFQSRSDRDTNSAAVSVKLRETSGVYFAKFLSRAEEVYVLMAATPLSPPSLFNFTL
jgi:hypothetical protein